jgi:hypothetical protein
VVAVLLAALESPGVDRVTELTTGPAVLGAMSALIVSVTVAFGTTADCVGGAGRVHTTVRPVAEQAKPFPPEPVVWKVRPAGNVSVTVMVPVVAAVPEFVTVTM